MYLGTLTAEVDHAPDDALPDATDPALVTLSFGGAVVIEWVVPDGYGLLYDSRRVHVLEEFVADKLRSLFHAQLD